MDTLYRTVRPFVLEKKFLPLLYAEAVLLVCYYERKILESYIICQKRMCSYDHPCFTACDLILYLSLLRSLCLTEQKHRLHAAVLHKAG